jgi:site-specific DNA recombinase
MKTPNTATQGFRYFLYARKSTDSEDRQVRSIDDQLAELRELASKENITIVKTFIEKQSAKIPGRPLFNDMLERIEAGEAEGIIAWHPDRLARNSMDGGKIVYFLDMGRLHDLKFCVGCSFENTSQGKFMLQIAFSQSKYYVDNLSENIKRGQRQKLKNGLWPQEAPLGYLNDKATKLIVIDPPKALLVKKAFELYASGTYSFALLATTMAELGLVGRKKIRATLSPANFQYLLQNPFYCGLIRFNGELYEGKHDAIISKELFDRAQERMKHRCKPNKKKAKYFALRGLMNCGGCGCLITAEKQKGHNYYRCTKRKGSCSQPYVREEALEAQISEYFEKLALPDDLASWLTSEITREQAESAEAGTVQSDRLSKLVKEVVAKLDRLMEGYLEQAISLPEYQKQKNKLVEEKHRLKEKLTSSLNQKGSWFEPALRFVSDCNRATDLARNHNLEEKRDFLQKVGSNLLLSEKLLAVTPCDEWEIVANKGYYVLSPYHPEGAEIKKSAGFPTGSNWRSRRDSNPRYGFKAVQRFSKPSPSATRPQLQYVKN